MNLNDGYWTYDYFIQEMLPAMTKMANSPTQEIHMN
jgi:hypothetical protein